ncbi:MAG: sugar-binding protein [Verrucomicrobiales bacterium]
MIKKCYGWILLGALALLVGCGKKSEAGGEAHFAFLTTGVAGFWDIAKKGAEDAGKELGVKVDVLMPSSGADQKQKIEDLLARGVDGMAVAAIDPANQTSLFNEVAKRAIFITADTDAPEADRRVYIGMDNYAAGWMVGDLLREALPEGGDIALFVGRMEQDNARRRRQGIIDNLLEREKDRDRYDETGQILAGGKFRILATLTDQFDRNRGKTQVEDMMTKHPDIAAMVGLFEYNPAIIIEALKQADKLGEIKVVGFDENEMVLQGIKDGHVHGTVVQNPYEYGKRSMEVLKALSEGDDSVIPENKFIDIPARTIRQDNVDEFWADLKAKMAR